MTHAHHYRFQGYGSCLGAVAPSGSWFDVDATKPIEMGDLVAVAFKPEGPFRRQAANFQGQGLEGVVKLFVGTEETAKGNRVYLVAQLNPPTVISVPAEALAAVHAVVGMQRPPESDGMDTTDDEMAYDLITPFFRRGTVPAVNPDWRPEGSAEGAYPLFSAGILETAAGPTIGTAADVIEMLMKSRDSIAGKVVGDEARAPYADALNLALNNNPFFYANLFYVRPALDWLFLNSLKDAVSPGYLKRQRKRRLKDYGQRHFIGTAF
ncbi:hypothetical protein ACSBOB_20365 [Mesorhizobium sp. ASY16-5R]|uniref:hypothetical protein n=1 Tax=Mesorhizobium sp. ASY16-5R TaxID=3445772 RepID=UPI003FA08FFE